MRTIHLVWNKPDGPEPDYYRVSRYQDFPQGYHVSSDTIDTEWIGYDYPGKCRYEVRAHYPTGDVSEPCILCRSFAITDIDIIKRDDADAGTTIVGVVVTFATEPGRKYTLQKSSDMANWTDVATLVATSDELSIGGDVNEPSVRYRVLEEI